MSEENKHMDDAFKKLNEGFKVNYSAAFWDEAAAKLDDANLDDAFRAAALSTVVSPEFNATQEVDNIFMDGAFVAASEAQSATYNPDFFEAFKASEANLEMDEAFHTAAGATVVDYMPKYWNDADKALQAEGLHYEYNSAYWKEAKRLLDRSDRRIFFAKWTAVAAVLLMFSFSGQFLGPNKLGDGITVPATAESNLNEISVRNTNSSINDITAIENLIANKAIVRDDFDSESNNNIFDNNGPVNVNAQNGGNVAVDPVNVGINASPNQIGVAGGNGRTPINLNNNQSLKNPIISVDNSSLSSFFNNSTTLNSKEDVIKLPYSLMNDIQNELEAPLLDINKGQDRPRGMHTFSVLLNGGAGNKWGELELTPTLRTAAGFEYNYSPVGIFKNFEFGVNLMANHIRQTNLGVEKRTSVYELDGGVSKYWYKLQMKDIIFANVNLSAAYRLAPKHKLKVGAGFEHMLAMNSNMSFRDNHVEEITTVNNNWGVRDGINNIDLRLSLGYEFQLTNRIALQLSGNIGFFDRTNDDFMGTMSNDRELNVMGGIKYTLFRKI